MGLHRSELPREILDIVNRGAVIPAHPLALTRERDLDRRRQRALTRYYVDAGAGGIAVGVHTTQFAIRDAGLFEPVLALAAETADAWSSRSLVRIAGAIGRTGQAVREAEIARALGYHAVLLSLAAFRGEDEDSIIAHCRRVAQEMPLVGFYLQPAVGGAPLPASFWRRFAEIDNVVAIKMAPFNRYRTLDVIHGVVDARAEDRIALYTGNDDAIVFDLVAPVLVRRGDEAIRIRVRGGLLGHWSVWARGAVALLERIRRAVDADSVDAEILALAGKVTDCNAAFFDAANDFRGCIAGCHEVLRRQGLLEGIWCIDPDEGLSPGQAAEIDRVHAAYPELNDDAFVSENLERWLS